MAYIVQLILVFWEGGGGLQTIPLKFRGVWILHLKNQNLDFTLEVLFSLYL